MGFLVGADFHRVAHLRRIHRVGDGRLAGQGCSQAGRRQVGTGLPAGQGARQHQQHRGGTLPGPGEEALPEEGCRPGQFLQVLRNVLLQHRLEEGLQGPVLGLIDL